MAKNDEPKKAAPIEAEIVIASPRAVMQTPKQLTLQMERDKQIRAIIDDYIKNNMVSGKDYGSIDIRGKQSKPSLFKPGAEKFCGLFKIRPTFRKDPETVEMLGNTPGIIAYICELVDSRGRVIGEGRGATSVNVRGADFDINKAIKMAEKRAQIDAVLRTGALSDFFTQDMEDAPRTTQQPARSGSYGNQNKPQPKDTDAVTPQQKQQLKNMMTALEMDKDAMGMAVQGALGKETVDTHGDFKAVVEALES